MDVFLSYNSADREAVTAVLRLLGARGFRAFMDRQDLVAGLPWPQALERALDESKSVAVFLGEGGLGGWQKREVYSALVRQERDEREGRAFPVVPVLLPRAGDEVGGFLALATWVDLRRGLDAPDVPEALDALERALRGARDGRRAAAEVCPYRGLHAFREEDAPFFHGRRAAAERLLAAVTGRDLTALVGASGSGKSSLVQAGLLPLLQRERPPRPTWEAVVLRPGARPFRALAAALVPLVEPAERSAADLRIEARKWEALLAGGAGEVADMIALALERSGGTDRLLVVVDQLEEILAPEADAERGPFLDALLGALGRAPFALLLGLRADFYGRAIELAPALAERLPPGQVNLGAMTQEELAEAITAPARLAGVGFEPGLAERLVDDVEGRPGDLPLLQFALTALWSRRRDGVLTHAAYQEVGGVAGALAAHAEAGLAARLAGGDLDAARRLFTRLVRVPAPGEAGGEVRRRTPLAALDPAAAALARALAPERLLVLGRDGGEGGSDGDQTVELAHEALIRRWGRLAAWIDEDRELLLWRQRLEARRREWEGAGRDPEALLAGALLAEAERWAAERSNDLSEEERAFVAASVAERDRRRGEEEARRQRELEQARALAEEQRRRAELRARAVRGLAALLAVAVAAAGLAAWQWRESVAERRRVVVRSLSRDAGALAATRPQRAALLAAQALALAARAGEPRHPPAEEALRAAVADLGGTVLGPGLPGARLLAASPEGDRLAEWDADGKLRVWRIAERGSAGEPLVLDGPPGAPERLAIVAGGRWLLAATERAARLWRLGGTDRPAPVDLPLDGGRLLAAAPSPGGRWLVTRTTDGPLTLWSLAGEEPTGPLALEAGGAAAQAHAFSSDDRRLAAGDAAGAVRLWDLASGDPAPVAALPGGRRAVLVVALLPSGLVVAGDGGGEVALWDPTTGARSVLGTTGAAVDRLAVSPDGGWLAALGRGPALLQRLERGRPAGPTTSFDTALLDLAFAGGDRLATVGRRGELWLSPLGTAGESVLLEPGGVRSAAFLTGGWLAAGGEDGAARLWRLDGPGPGGPTRLDGHEGPVTAVAVLAGGRRLATGAEGDRPRLWDLGRHDPAGPTEPAVLGGRGRTPGHAGPVLALGFTGDGKLLTGGADRRLGAWDAASEDPHPTWTELPGPPGLATVIALTANGRRAAVATGSEVAVLDLPPGGTSAIVATLPHGAPVAALALSPGGRRLATGLAAPGGGAEVRLWDLGSRPPTSRLLRSHDGRVDALAWSADGRWLVTAGGGDAARLYDVASGAELPAHKLEGHGTEVTAAAWSLDGRWLATAGGDRDVRLWTIDDGEPGEAPAAVLRGDGGGVRALAWSADGRWLATAGDGGARLWDRERSAAGAVTLPGPAAARALAFSPDGRWLAAGGEGGIRRYRLRLDELTAFACRAVGRELSDAEWREHLPSERRRAGEPCSLAER